MKAQIVNSKHLDILGNGDRLSAQEVLTATLKRWRQRLGYCSIFAVIPAILAPNIPVAHSDESKKPEVSAVEPTPERLRRQNNRSTNRALLKRQSEFRLPHQKGNFAITAALAGNDDCPGRAITGGNYTAAAPYIDSGDTTGANNTIKEVPSYYYYFYGNYSAHGPDHVYSFTLTSAGPNAQITVSTTSGTYKPLIYVLQSEPDGKCPAGTGNVADNVWTIYDSRWNANGSSTATVFINWLPLNVPFHLFVDSAINDAFGAGPYTIKMQDVTIAPAVACAEPNPIDCEEVFVTQQYFDFLNRAPDPAGFEDWMEVLNSCHGDLSCLYGPNGKRTIVSQGFFGSPEFNLRGGYIFRFYKSSLARIPTYDEMIAGMTFVSGATANELEQKRAEFAANWVVRTDFLNAFPRSLTAQQFVDNISQTAGITLANRDQIISFLNANNTDVGRAVAMRAIVDSHEAVNKELNAAFVYMQYVGYLHRNPEEKGYNEWLTYLNTHPGDYNTMVWGFVDSLEYRRRFGP
jgi:hypothetical protein